MNLCVKNVWQIKKSQDYVESQRRSHITKDLEKRIKNKPVEIYRVLGSTNQTQVFNNIFLQNNGQKSCSQPFLMTHLSISKILMSLTCDI